MNITISRFPGKVKKNTGKWHADRYFLPGKCYKSVVARCCTLRLSDISVSETEFNPTVYDLFKPEFRM